MKGLLQVLPAKRKELEDIIARLNRLQAYLKRDFGNNLELHSNCATHCIQYNLCTDDRSPGALGRSECTCADEPHNIECAECVERFTIFEDLRALIQDVDVLTRTPLEAKLQSYQDTVSQYVGHQIRTVHQRSVLKQFIGMLTPTSVVVLCDFKMKILFQLLRENCQGWYGKRGASLLGVMFIFLAPGSDTDLLIEWHDLVSEDDTRQDWFFSASGLEAITRKFRSAHPHITEEYRITDNGPHFHATGLLLWNMQYEKVHKQIAGAI